MKLALMVKRVGISGDEIEYKGDAVVNIAHSGTGIGVRLGRWRFFRGRI